MASGIFLGTLVHTTQTQVLAELPIQQEQAEVQAVRYGEPATTDNMPGTAQGATEDKAQPQGETILDLHVCLCKAGSS